MDPNKKTQMAEQEQTPANMTPRDWVQILAKYREPNSWRSSFELAISLIPFVILWVLACWVAQYSYMGAFVISAANGLFLLRYFASNTIAAMGHSTATAVSAIG